MSGDGMSKDVIYARNTDSGYNQLHTVTVSLPKADNLLEWKLSGSEGACL